MNVEDKAGLGTEIVKNHGGALDKVYYGTGFCDVDKGLFGNRLKWTKCVLEKFQILYTLLYKDKVGFGSLSIVKHVQLNNLNSMAVLSYFFVFLDKVLFGNGRLN